MLPPLCPWISKAKSSIQGDTKKNGSWATTKISRTINAADWDNGNTVFPVRIFATQGNLARLDDLSMCGVSSALMNLVEHDRIDGIDLELFARQHPDTKKFVRTGCGEGYFTVEYKMGVQFLESQMKLWVGWNGKTFASKIIDY